MDDEWDWDRDEIVDMDITGDPQVRPVRLRRSQQHSLRCGHVDHRG
jgi:hypothetical protein